MPGTTTFLSYPSGITLGGTFLGQVDDQSVDTQLADISEIQSGDFGPSFTGSGKAEPEFSLSTMDITGLLDEIDVEAVAKSYAAGDVRLLYRKATSHGLRVAAATAQHVAYSLNLNSLLFWDSLSVSQDEQAKISAKVIGTLNGLNDPLTAVPAAAVTAPPVITDLFTLGDIYLNGSLINGVQSVQWTNNVEVEKVASNGEATPSFVTIKSYAPVCTFETTDIDSIADLTNEETGLPVSGTGLVVFLRKRALSGLNVADATAEHVKLVATAGTIKFRRTSQSPGRATVDVVMHRPAAEAAIFAYTKDVAIAAPV